MIVQLLAALAAMVIAAAGLLTSAVLAQGGETQLPAEVPARHDAP